MAELRELDIILKEVVGTNGAQGRAFTTLPEL
jgi:hypothetical protein